MRVRTVYATAPQSPWSSMSSQLLACEAVLAHEAGDQLRLVSDEQVERAKRRLLVDELLQHGVMSDVTCALSAIKPAGSPSILATGVFARRRSSMARSNPRPCGIAWCGCFSPVVRQLLRHAHPGNECKLHPGLGQRRCLRESWLLLGLCNRKHPGGPPAHPSKPTCNRGDQRTPLRMQEIHSSTKQYLRVRRVRERKTDFSPWPLPRLRSGPPSNLLAEHPLGSSYPSAARKARTVACL